MSLRMKVLLKKMVAKLEDEIQKCKRASFETNEHLNMIELKETSNEEEMDMMRGDVSEMKNVCTRKSWTDVCGGDVLSNSSIFASDESRENFRKHRYMRIERA